MKTSNQRPESRRSAVAGEILSWLAVLFAYVLITGTLVEARVIPSPSMERTILIGDHLLVERFGYDAGVPFTNWHLPLWRDPERQQVIVFHAPLPGSPDLIKRVIGLPGERVEIRHGVVLVNGHPLAEPYVARDPRASDDFAPITVPPDSYFVLGDNRRNSYDSRYWGFVPRRAIVGRALLIYLSVDGPGDVWEPGHFGERLVTYGDAIVHPSRVRWTRFFRMLP